jgi:maleylpyruvate isomerase
VSDEPLAPIGPQERQGRSKEWIVDGTHLFESLVDRVDESNVTASGLLPEWRRAEIVAHVARNADALVNLVEWAKTGVPSPMYPRVGVREEAIAASAQQSVRALRSDLETADRRLADAFASMTPDAWSSRVLTAQGRDIPAVEVLWMRVREVWLHAVDLDLGFGVADLPVALAVALLTEASERFGGRGDYPALELVVPESSGEYRLGPDDHEPFRIVAPVRDVVGWIIGRSERPVPGAPALPPWL